MRLNTFHTCIPTILCGLLLTGCANQDNGKAKPDSTAFEWAMDQDIRFNTLLDECEKVDSSLINSNKTRRQEWKKQYWNTINSANYQFNQQQAAKIYIYNGEKLSLPAVKFMVERKASALREIYSQKRLSEKQVAYCQARLAAYEKKEDGLGSPLHKNKLQYLNELAPKATMLTPQTVPSLAGSLQSASPGPALYGIEQQAGNNNCSNPEIITLLHQGHKEFYGVYCANSANYFVSCEWSQCSALK